MKCLGWIGIAAVLGLAGCAPTMPPGTTYLHAEDAMGPYSGSVLSGTLCFVSGKVGHGESFEQAAAEAIDAVDAELRRAGLSLSEVVQVTVYLTDMGNYSAFNDVYVTRFREPFPARAVVEVAALPGGARLEIQAIARRQ